MTIASTLFSLIQGVNGADNTGPSLDSLLAQFDRELENFDSLIQPAPESKPRTPFDGDTPPEKQSLRQMTPGQMAKVLPIMLPLVYQMRRSSRYYDGTFQPTEHEVSPEFLAELEALARRSGAKDISYVRVPRNAIFHDKGIPYEYAIVFTVEMDQDTMSTAPSYEAFREVAKGYRNLAVIGNKMAKVMRENGFAAYPGTALGGITDYCHLAELAGLGAIGYHGLLIAPGEGARLRINTIYTNITNLPLVNAADNPHLWVRDFCAMCHKCIRQCPVDAIFDQPQPRGDGGMQCIDHDACRSYFNENFGCAICLAVCPFSVAGYDAIQLKFRGNPSAPQFRIPIYNIDIVDERT